MKKLIAISILLTVLSAAAFAENEDAGGKLLPGFHVRLQGEFQPDLLKITAPTGDAANTDIFDPTKSNIAPATGNMPGTGVPDRVDSKKGNYAGTGTFDFLTTYGTWKKNDLDVIISYADPDAKFAGLVNLNAQNWLPYLAQGSYDGGNKAPTSDAADGSADAGQSLLDFLSIPFGDWYLWGKVGIFRGWAGNTAQRGVVARFQDTATTFVDKFKIDNYGIVNPYGAALDINNLGKNVRTDTPAKDYSTDPATDVNPPAQGGNAYVALQADLSPITVNVASDLGTFFDAKKKTDKATSYAAAGAAVQVSAKGIADIVDFDVIYKLRGIDPTTDDKLKTGAAGDTARNEQPDGKGTWEHAFGLYANLNIIDGLGIGLGYSGSVRASEDKKGTDDKVVKDIFPYFNGIDLRFKLSMIDKLTITFNNNISFSAVQNDDDLSTKVYGVKYASTGTDGFSNSGSRDKEYKDSYLALYNHLALSYALTDALSANVSIGNKLNTYNSTDDHDETKQIVYNETTDTFIGTAYAAYAFTRNVKLEGGLAFQATGNSLELTDKTSQDWGTFTFGIPIRFSVRF